MPLTGEAKREYQREWLAKRRARAIEYIGGECVSCHSTEQLEFDHVDKDLKRRSISSLLSGSWDLLLEELAKCQLLCKDCHKAKSDYEKGYDHIVNKKRHRNKMRKYRT